MLALIDEQVAQIAASIREWGWTVPVLVDEDGTLIAGHGRVLAAQRLGVTDVPTMVARGWSDARKRAYVIDPRRRDAVAVPLPAPLPALSHRPFGTRIVRVHKQGDHPGLGK
jgi:ParB-like chromosome segregation protein Spo0J